MYYIQNINDVVAVVDTEQDFINYVKCQNCTDVLFLENVTREDLLNDRGYLTGQYLLKNSNEIELVEKIEKVSNMFFGSTFSILHVSSWKLLKDSMLNKPTKRTPLPENPPKIEINVGSRIPISGNLGLLDTKWLNEYQTFNEDDVRHQYITNAIKMYDLIQDRKGHEFLGYSQKYNLYKFIVENNACVAGSFPLSRLLMSLGNKCKSRDMDIYVKDSKALDIEKQFMNNAKLVYDKYRYVKHEYAGNNNNNKIVKIYKVIDYEIDVYGRKIDIIIIDSSVNNLVKYINDSFDLDFCKTIYTSKMLYVYHYDATIKMKGNISYNQPVQCLTQEYYDKMKNYENKIVNYKDFLQKLVSKINKNGNPHTYLTKHHTKNLKIFDPMNCLVRIAKYQYREFDVDASNFSFQLIKLYEE